MPATTDIRFSSDLANGRGSPPASRRYDALTSGGNGPRGADPTASQRPARRATGTPTHPVRQNVVVGYNSYEVRGSEVYPYVSDDFDEYGLPMFEIRGSEVYPTTFNNRDEYGLPAFEIRDGYAYPTSFNNHDDFGFEVCQDDSEVDNEDDPATSDAYAWLGDLAALAIRVGLFAGDKAYFHVKERRQKASVRKAANSQVSTASALASPPGWYPMDGGPRYWNGVAWTEDRPPAGFPAYQPAFQAPPVMIPPKGRGAVAIAWILTVLSGGYMLPWAVAVTRGTSNSSKVGLVCFLLGWTVVGWIAALVMACTGLRATHPQYRA